MFINGEEVRDYRLAHGISIEEMSQILGIEDEDLCYYENGGKWYVEDSLLIYTLNSMFDDLAFIPLEELDFI